MLPKAHGGTEDKMLIRFMKHKTGLFVYHRLGDKTVTFSDINYLCIYWTKIATS